MEPISGSPFTPPEFSACRHGGWRGRREAAHDRLDALQNVTLLNATKDSANRARELLEMGAIPRNAADDAVHIAIAATNGVDYLVTWNFQYIANATMRSRIDSASGLRATGHLCAKQTYGTR